MSIKPLESISCRNLSWREIPFKALLITSGGNLTEILQLFNFYTLKVVNLTSPELLL